MNLEIRKVLLMLVLVSCLSIITGAAESAVTQIPMTVEEFGDLIGYESVRKLCIGPYPEATGVLVTLKVDIYRNKKKLDYWDYETHQLSNISPLEPEETIIFTRTLIHSNEAVLSYAVSIDELSSGYKLHYILQGGVFGQRIIDVPEIFNKKSRLHTYVFSAELMEEHMLNSSTVPYFCAGINTSDSGSGIIPGGLPLSDLDKMAAYFDVFIVLSYEAVPR